jgi:hypothetical protein
VLVVAKASERYSLAVCCVCVTRSAGLRCDIQSLEASTREYDKKAGTRPSGRHEPGSSQLKLEAHLTMGRGCIAPPRSQRLTARGPSFETRRHVVDGDGALGGDAGESSS